MSVIVWSLSVMEGDVRMPWNVGAISVPPISPAKVPLPQPGRQEPGRNGLFIAGPPGTGKTHHHRNSHIHDAAMAKVDVWPLKAHRLQSGQGVTAKAALTGNGILPYDAAELRAAAMLCHGVAFQVNADDGCPSHFCQLILYLLPKWDIQDAFHVKVRSGHGTIPPLYGFHP